MEKIKIVAYLRKSTDEADKQQQSIWTQMVWLEEYLENHPEFEIVETIIEKESAKARWRKWFEKMMNYVEEKWVKYIISMYIDRLSRNPYDNGWIQWLLQEWKIEKIITSTRVYTIEESGLLFSVESWFANEYILKLKKWVKDWLKSKIDSGWYYSQAPLWYKNNILTKSIDIDEERAFYIPQIFDLRIKWYTVSVITEEMYKRWLRSKKWYKVSKATIERILHNPFYYWYFVYNWALFNKWELYKGNHTPIISYEIFMKAQDMNRWVVYQTNQELTPLKWKVFSYETKKLMSASLVKKKYVFFQYKIEGKQYWFNEQLILDYFDENIDLYKIPKEHKEIVKEIIRESYFKELEEIQKQISILKWKKTKKEIEKNNLIFLRSNFEITGEEFVSLKNQLMVEIKNFDDQIKNLESKNEKDLIEFNDLVELLFFALDKWKSYDRGTKFQIINELVVELYFDKQKRLYIEEKLLYKTFKIYNLSKWSGGRGLNSHTQGLKP